MWQWLALDEMDLQWTPIRNTWRLNERNYGALQGLVKPQCAEKYGLKQVQKWRRGYADRPPPWSDAAVGEMMDRRYDAAKAEAVAPSSFPPRSESLSDCVERTLPFLYDELQQQTSPVFSYGEQQEAGVPPLVEELPIKPRQV